MIVARRLGVPVSDAYEGLEPLRLISVDESLYFQAVMDTSMTMRPAGS